MYAPTIPVDKLQLDPSQEWPEQGSWTYDDYLRLPVSDRLPENELRYEIIRGVLYVNAAPSYDHQYTVSRINKALTNFVDDHELGIVLTSPFTVHLATSSRPVEPDILFIPTWKMPAAGSKYMVGAPDLVVEVLSPSTRRKDFSVKLDAYELAGVNEYWIVDLVQESILLFMLPDGGREYVEVGVFKAGDTLKSPLLPKFTLDIGSIFV